MDFIELSTFTESTSPFDDFEQMCQATGRRISKYFKAAKVLLLRAIHDDLMKPL